MVPEGHRGRNDTVPHDHLDDPYRADTIDLGKDEEGPVVATLISRTDSPRNGHAVLYIHGFSDYFFHPHVADHFVERGYAFYAIDLRKAGRSVLPHQTPHYVRHVAQYFAELDIASRMIRNAGHDRILVYAHSAGGLTASLWAHRLGDADWLQGLILNSPFLGIDMSDTMLRLLMAPIDIAGLLVPRAALPHKGVSVNVLGLHADFRGEWDFNLDWKPYSGTPIRMGWLRGIRRAQRRVHRGLNVQVPVLVMVAKTSLRTRHWTSDSDAADTVLNADAILRWSHKLGPEVARARITGARHDLALSTKPARARFFAAIDAWLVEQGFVTPCPVDGDVETDIAATPRCVGDTGAARIGVSHASSGGFHA